MIILRGKIKALEPLHLGNGITIGTFVQTLPYIPARTIRGMLGNYLFYENKELFQKLRINEDDDPMLRFKPALPEGSIATPLSFRWCKKCGKRLRDGICPEDFHEGSKKSGLMMQNSLKAGKFEAAKISKSINTKCPIHPERHASYTEDEPLSPYHIESIIAGTSFDFRLVLPEGFLDELKESLQNAGLFYKIGGFRSRGYGMIKFDFEEEEDVEEYVERRSTEIKEKSWLVLNSPAIFKMNDNRYSDGLTGELLDPYFKKIAQMIGRGYEKPQVSDVAYKQTFVRGWKLAGGYHLDEILPAVDLGSSACLEKIDPELAAWSEVFGIGGMSHVYGDVYFLPEEDGS